jgi:hypothetical protein
MNPRKLVALFPHAAALTVSTSIAACFCPAASPVPPLALPRRLAARARDMTADCPAPKPSRGGEWKVEPVFKARPGKPLPPLLRGRCLYTWTSDGPADAAGIPFEDLASVAEDPRIVVGLGSDLDGALQSATVKARGDLVQQAGLPGAGAAATNGPQPLPAQPSPAWLPAAFSGTYTPVYIGFPDSSPPNKGDQIPVRGDAHGFNVAWITRYLTCPAGASSTCLSSPITALAFDQAAAQSGNDTPGTAGSGKGTDSGSRTAFAQAIVDIVDRWQEAKDGRHLILNLAEGWDPQYECVPSVISGTPAPPAVTPGKRFSFPGHAPIMDPGTGGTGSPIPLDLLAMLPLLPLLPADCNPQISVSEPAQDVYLALLYASCQGALIVSAAGNDPGYENPPSGPMLPASWDRFAAPPAALCSKLLDSQSASPAGGPLVHAVAGVDGNDRPMMLGRLASRSEIVAPSSILAAYPESAKDAEYGGGNCQSPPCEPTRAMTGTSVAVAVTSAAAAAVWAHHPDWTGSKVMAVLYETGEPLGLDADCCLAPPCQKAHRVSMCRALECGDGADLAACSKRCAPRPAYGGDPMPGNLSEAPIARSSVPFVPGLLGDVTGQPDVPPCPACGVSTGPALTTGYPMSLTGSIDLSFLADTGETSLSSPTLTFYDRNQTAFVTSDLSWTPPSTAGLVWNNNATSVQATAAATPVQSTTTSPTATQGPPVSATVTWIGGSGRIYPQVISVATSTH